MFFRLMVSIAACYVLITIHPSLAQSSENDEKLWLAFAGSDSLAADTLTLTPTLIDSFAELETRLITIPGLDTILSFEPDFFLIRESAVFALSMVSLQVKKIQPEDSSPLQTDQLLPKELTLLMRKLVGEYFPTYQIEKGLLESQWEDFGLRTERMEVWELEWEEEGLELDDAELWEEEAATEVEKELEAEMEKAEKQP